MSPDGRQASSGTRLLRGVRLKPEANIAPALMAHLNESTVLALATRKGGERNFGSVVVERSGKAAGRRPARPGGRDPEPSVPSAVRLARRFC